MSNLEVSLKVFFSGVWRSQSVNDQLLLQISNLNTKKRKQLKGSPAVLNLTDQRLDILIFDDKGAVTRNDQVPLQDIVELTADKHAATCIFAIVRDNINKQFYIFAFHCASDKDAGELIQGYGRVKQRLSGEGFNTDIKPGGVNWTLQQKQDQVTEKPTNGHVTFIQKEPAQNGDVRILSTEKEEGETRILTGETTGPMASDKVSVSDPEMKEELHHLAGEIRDIKLMLRKSHGRQVFQKHYQYLINDDQLENSKSQVIKVTDAKPVENEISYNIGSTVVQPVSQYRSTVVQPGKHAQNYRTTIVRPSNDSQQYRSTVIQPVANSQQYRATVVQSSPQVQQYSSTVVQPATHRTTVVQSAPQVQQYRTVVQPAPQVHHYKRTTVHRSPQIRHYKSTRSTASSVQSGYTKRVYDSVNPMIENKQYLKYYQPKNVTKTDEKVVQQKMKKQPLIIHSPSDKVNKRIENVYKHRAYKMVIPSDRRPAEYVTVGHYPRSPVILAQQLNADDNKVKQYIETKTSESVIHKETHEPEIRHVYQSDDTANETVVSENVVSVNQQNIVVTEEPVTTVRYEEHTTSGDVKHDNDTVVIVAQGVANENEVASENVLTTSRQAVVVSEPVVREYTTAENVEYGEDVIVVKANTENYRIEGEPTSEGEPEIQTNSVYYVKAEGIDSLNAERNVVIEKSSQIESTIIQPKDENGDGLFENYADDPDPNAASETIIRETAYLYHDNDDNNAAHGIVREEKRVHYMDELEQTINDYHDEDDDHNIRQELEDINGKLEDNIDDDYQLDEEELKMFSQVPDVVLVEKNY